MKNTGKQGSMKVISLDARRKKPVWDKPLTTDFESDRTRQLESRDEALETSHEKRGLVLGFHHKVFRS